LEPSVPRYRKAVHLGFVKVPSPVLIWDKVPFLILSVVTGEDSGGLLHKVVHKLCRFFSIILHVLGDTP
jgi:hypothetical protein